LVILIWLFHGHHEGCPTMRLHADRLYRAAYNILKGPIFCFFNIGVATRRRQVKRAVALAVTFKPYWTRQWLGI